MVRPKVRKQIFALVLVFGSATMIVLNYLFFARQHFAEINNHFFLGLFEQNAIAATFSIITLLALIIFSILYTKNDYMIPLGLVIIGATSNFVSRMIFGGVYDYIPLIITRVNIEDILIVIGFTLMLMQMMQRDESLADLPKKKKD